MNRHKSFNFKIELGEKANLIRLIIGAAVFAAGFVFERNFYLQQRFQQTEFFTVFVFFAAYIILGGDFILRALRNIVKGRVFDENFLMSAATIGAFAIGEAPEAVGVMLFYQIGEYFQEAAVNKSKKSIAGLMDIRPDFANLIKDGKVVKAAPDTVRIGDLIIIKPGEKIPLDGIVIEGSSMIDTSALTGESVPKKATTGCAVLSGCVNLSGVLTVEAAKTFGESTVSKIINLVENSANKKAKTEKFITRFARVYTPIVAALALLLALVPPLFFAGEWKAWLYRALVFLVISCPCALVLSIPMGFFAGIGRAAKNGILVKGGNYLEAFKNLHTVVFDKTGTLTKGVFKAVEIKSANGFTESALLEFAAYAECFSNHPIALSVMQEYSRAGLYRDLDKSALYDYTELAGFGVSVGMNGRVIIAGSEKLLDKNGVKYSEDSLRTEKTGTKVYVAVDNVYAGCIVISDEIKADSFAAVAALRERGVKKIVMLTGDNPGNAKITADELKIDEFHGGLLPHEKVEIVEKLIKEKNSEGKGRLAFVGDGINDAPVLAMADIGAAMGALGSDAAIEAADVVLMTDEPSKLAAAVDIAVLTGKIVRQNIIFSLGVKAVFLVLGAFGIASMWEAVFADVGVSLLAVLNAMRIMQSRLHGRF